MLNGQMIRCPALVSLRAELARRVGDVLEVSREEGGEVEGGEGGSSLLTLDPRREFFQFVEPPA